MTIRSDGSGYRSQLSELAPLLRQSDPSHGRAAAQVIWQQTGLIVINPQHVGWVTGQQAIQLAEKIYGKRKGGAK